MSAEKTPPAFATSREMADAARSAWCSVVIEVVLAEVKMLQGVCCCSTLAPLGMRFGV